MQNRTLIFKTTADVLAVGQLVPACEYVYYKTKGSLLIREIRPEDYPKLEFFKKLKHKNQLIGIKNIETQKLERVTRKLTNEVMVYQDTGDVVDESCFEIKEKLWEKSSQTFKYFIPGKRGLIPNNFQVINGRAIVRIIDWFEKYAWVYLTSGDEIVYVPKNKYYVKKGEEYLPGIRLDETTGMHITEDGFQVTTVEDLRQIRAALLKQASATNNANNSNNQNHSSPAHANSVLNNVLFYKNETSDVLFIYPTKFDAIINVIKDLNILKPHLEVNTTQIPFILKIFDGNPIDIASQVQTHFPNVKIMNFLAQYNDVNFFYHGEPNTSIKINWLGHFVMQVGQLHLTAYDVISSMISKLGLQDIFNVDSIGDNSLNIAYGHDLLQDSHYPLQDVFDILISGTEDERAKLANRFHLIPASPTLDELQNLSETLNSIPEPTSSTETISANKSTINIPATKFHHATDINSHFESLSEPAEKKQKLNN